MFAVLLATIFAAWPQEIAVTAPDSLAEYCGPVVGAMREDSVNVHVAIVGPVFGWWGPFNRGYRIRVPRGGEALIPLPRPGRYFFLSYATNRAGQSCMRRDTVIVFVPAIRDLKADPE